MKKILTALILVALFIVISYKNSKEESVYKVVSYKGANLRISIDGISSSSLPSSGNYYLVNYDCSSLNSKVMWDRNNYKLNISNKNKNADVSCNLEFRSNPLLSEMSIGSYVLYEGNNGCAGIHCNGYNANYESEDKMGFCSEPTGQFYVNGWRIGYIEDNSSVLISAGAPECMCTSSDGSPSSSNCSDSLSANDINKHYDNMKNVALKYCNSNYIKGGSCRTGAIENEYVKVIDVNFFSKITGRTLKACFQPILKEQKPCGYNNDLIDNGGLYWFGTNFSANFTFGWTSIDRTLNFIPTQTSLGVRPVLTLDSSVIVTGGDGTYESPYLIDNNYFIVGDGSGILNSNNDLSNVELSFNSIVEVSKMCIGVDTSSCSNYIDYSDSYTLDLSNAGTGEKIIYVYYKDAYNKIVAAMQRTIVINNES